MHAFERLVYREMKLVASKWIFAAHIVLQQHVIRGISTLIMFLSCLFLLQAPLLVWGISVSGKDKLEAPGVLLLDSITYSIVEELRPETRVMIGIFDKKKTAVTDPLMLETQARANFLEFAQVYSRDPSSQIDHLLFAQIIVNGAQNKYLKQRLVGDMELPVFVILGENKTSPYIIDSDLRDYRYCTFISMLNQYAGYTNILPGVLSEFSALAKRFMALEGEARLAVLGDARKLYDTIDDKGIIADADFYVGTMQKVVDGGVQYLKEEAGSIIARTRLSKISEDRKFHLDKRLNILEVFWKFHSDEPMREAAYPYILLNPTHEL